MTSFQTVDLNDSSYENEKSKSFANDSNETLLQPRYESKWNDISNGGTILNDPRFKNDFNVEYRIWSNYKKANVIPKNPLSLLLPSSSHKMSNSEWSLKSMSDQDSAKLLNTSINCETQRLVDTSNRILFDDSSNDEFEDDKNSLDNTRNCGLYQGIIYSSLSSVFFSLCAVIVKYLKNIHPGQLAVSRFFGIFVLTIPMIVFYDLNPFGPRELRHILVLRGLAGATSLYLRFCAFHYLPIADASVIIFSIPVFVSLFAWIFLKEPCGLFQTFTVSIAMIGLVMTTKLPSMLPSSTPVESTSNTHYYYQSIHSNTSLAKYYRNITITSGSQSLSLDDQKINHFYGVISALSSLIFASAVFIFIRKAKGVHHAVIMFNFGWIAIIETTIITTLMGGFSLPHTRFEWYLIVILSVFSFCGQILLTRALQLEQAGPVSVVRATTDIILAFIWQIVIFNETPDLWSIIGALLVSCCILLISLRKWIISLPEHSKLKEKFYFVLL